MQILGWRGNNLRFVQDRIAYITMLYEKYGDIATYAKNNPENWVFAFGPDYNRLLLSDTETFHHLQPIRLPKETAADRLVTGLLTLNGEDHRRHRSVLMQLFQRNHLTSYLPTMLAITEQHLLKWKIGQTLDLEDALKRLTLHIVCKTIFDIDINHNLSDDFRSWLSSLTSASVALLPPLDFPFSPFRRFNHLSERIEQMLKAEIERKRQEGASGQDVLSLLIGLQSAGGIADDEVIGEAMTLLLAGHETTAAALTWTFFLLSQAPRILTALVDEISGRLHGSAPSMDDLNHLPLLDRVVKETLRILPPVPYQHRIATVPFQLGSYAMPKGSIVSYSPYITHRMPHIYENPDNFLPSRWETLHPSVYEYLPFGAGARMCIGATFALMEIKAVLCVLLQRVNFALQPGAIIDRKSNVVLTPRYGLPVVITAPYQVQVQPSRSGNIWNLIKIPS
jgi:cytochrome P450